jgi:hypothetical protein
VTGDSHDHPTLNGGNIFMVKIRLHVQRPDLNVLRPDQIRKNSVTTMNVRKGYVLLACVITGMPERGHRMSVKICRCVYCLGQVGLPWQIYYLLTVRVMLVTLPEATHCRGHSLERCIVIAV